MIEKMELEDLTEVTVKEKAIEAADLVISKTTTSVSVLENLRPLLTNVEIGKRKLGLTFLSCFLSEMKKDFLNEEECRLFAEFYKDRMNDHHSLIPDIVFGMYEISWNWIILFLYFMIFRRKRKLVKCRNNFEPDHVQGFWKHKCFGNKSIENQASDWLT